MTAPEARFEDLARTCGPRLLGYALRRVDLFSDAADVVAEVLLVTWRRFDDVPDDPEDAMRWLYGVARRVLANHRRGRRRRHALGERLRADLAEVPRYDEADRSAVHVALGQLPANEREVLTLHAWEGLTSGEIASCLGIRPATARKRLERARRRMRKALEDRPRVAEPVVEPGSGRG